ncbi:MAG: glycosyltransferase family 1 protein [Acidimicrobiaceae bacterium]|nr:glycosyltransferase family 1 protein [Acidimicrobiaceae bacterium]
MRTLAACSLGGAGHLNPLLPFLAASERLGDEVVVAAPPALRDMVTEAGYSFEPGGEPSDAEVAVIREQLPVVPASVASVLGNRELFGRLATRAMLSGMQRVFEEWAPDLVLREPCEYASAVLAHRTGTPVAQVAISFADVEADSIAVAAPALEDHHSGLTDALMGTPYLTRFPRSLDPSPFPATVRYREPIPNSQEPLPNWWGDRNGPLIYMTFGTVLGHMAGAAGVYRAAVRALEKLDVRVLVTVGRQFDASSLRQLPRNIHVEAWVDQHRVLGHAALVVTHCGSGTALGSLAAGVPIVAVPLFADQFENSRRIADAGAALTVEGHQDDDPKTRGLLSERDSPKLAAAIEAMLADRDFQRNAGLISAEMAATPTPDTVLRHLPTTR